LRRAVLRSGKPEASEKTTGEETVVPEEPSTGKEELDLEKGETKDASLAAAEGDVDEEKDTSVTGAQVLGENDATDDRK
jgi:hypothetical protein